MEVVEIRSVEAFRQVESEVEQLGWVEVEEMKEEGEAIE